MGIPVIGCSCRVCRSPDEKDKRLRTSILISNDNKNILIDTGPDFRQQMLRHQVQHLDAILFTHEHKDHTAGLDDIRAFNFKQRNPIDVYATRHVQRELKKQFGYIFEKPNYPGLPKVNFKTISNKPFQAGGLTFLPIQVFHYKLPVLGFRIGDFTYITDANRIDDQELQKAAGSKVVVLNALRKEAHLSHFTLDEAVRLMEDIGPEAGFFIHMSHQMGRHEEINRELPAHLDLAFDGQQIVI